MTKKSVLLLEENEGIRTLIVETIGDSCRLAVVTTIAEARQQMEGITFDAAILDGYIAAERSTTERLAKDLLRSATKTVIAMSGSSGTLGAMMSAGCHAGFLKPHLRPSVILALLT